MSEEQVYIIASSWKQESQQRHASFDNGTDISSYMELRVGEANSIGRLYLRLVKILMGCVIYL